MSEPNDHWIRRIGRGNRLYWILAILALPVPALMAYTVSPIGCRCAYGSATLELFELGITLIGIRLLTGLIFGENRKKTVLYLLMPFVIGIIIPILGSIMGGHPH